ncbi:hypothetical protein BDA99DRAFT_540964 [Phascolomyces articulosus]|uniref:Rho-GAP domain-containing protein n=1 Tax=Phascolomyces articulosus TaxID=60185 RepID=A0AAD5K395_9FUNG|nr:hypothetical protein BDA99DRAFT_540964 [Phascolomyces articulosus]
MTQIQTEQQKTISKRRSFSAWLRRKVTPKAGVRKITPRSETAFMEPRAVFGIPLIESIHYARQTISYQDEDGTVYRQAGAIPMLVAKTGLFLKQRALQTEGIFRLSGSLKRIAALQEQFNKPPYGANVEWEGNTVHDAATLLRRYLNQLPDPVITHEYYQQFRDVMSKNSADNRMDACNLAAVFCPAILSHPSHNTPVQYKISQRVIEFLIEFQALFTMQMVNKNKVDHNDDDVPPVPVLPDWVGATFIAQKTVPPLDMETVHHQYGGVHGETNTHSPPLDSGTDVKTPAPFHLKDTYEINDDDNISTPRRMPSPPPSAVDGAPDSPIVMSPRSVYSSSKDHTTTSESHVLDMVGHLYNDYCKGNPMALGILASFGVILSLIIGYGGYQALTFRNLFNGSIFFGGLGLFWMMIMEGANKVEGQTSKEAEVETTAMESQEGVKDISTEKMMEQDRVTEEAIFKDESLMAEWGDLMNRSWRTDPTTPSIMRRNSSSDSYFNRQDMDEIDQASMLSLSSRFNEEQHNNSSDEDDYDDDDENWTPDLGEEELQRLWHQFQQVEKDKNLAEKLQREENAAERKRDEATNPFLVNSPPISPLNTEQESWKISARSQK